MGRLKDINSQNDLRIKEMQQGMPIGTEFQYLGMPMCVTGHSEYWPRLGHAPVLRADYFDNSGVLRHSTFTYAEYLSIRSKNP